MQFSYAYILAESCNLAFVVASFLRCYFIPWLHFSCAKDPKYDDRYDVDDASYPENIVPFVFCALFVINNNRFVINYALSKA